ncbi:MAG TPA: FecR domain-containing protein [Sphingobacteriaceae bacterium]
MSKKIIYTELRKMVRKYLRGKATEKEETFLNAYYDHLKNTDSEADLLNEDKNALGEEIRSGIVKGINSAEIKKITPLRIKIAAAAAILIFIAAGFYFTSINKQHDGLVSKPVKTDIAPGGNRAILTLADGSTVVLDSVDNGVIAVQGSMRIQKSKNGEIVYNGLGSSLKNLNNPASFNTISTPRGGTYQITLPDGTKAWLNSASSLKFPAYFDGKHRIVALTGEAYFEVAKNKAMPFKVIVNEMEVEVLGTHFNVMAYKEESSTNTTLLEGSVRVTKGSQSETLAPGQQARVSAGIKVFPADVKEAVAWKEGYFIFKNESIFSIMRKISRWYNVDIEYRGDVSSMVFGGIISRDRNVSEVFKILELTNAVHFKIEGRRIIVMP